jgi:hypothetical protein
VSDQEDPGKALESLASSAQYMMSLVSIDNVMQIEAFSGAPSKLDLEESTPHSELHAPLH